MSIDAHFYKQLLFTATEMYGEVCCGYTGLEELWKAFQDYGNSFSDDEYGQNCATHWKALTDRFFPNGWLAGDDDDAAMKNDEMLCGLYDYLEQAEDDYFGHDCLLEVWNLWQQNYAPECPEIIEHHMFPKYYGDSPGYPIDDGVLYFGLDTEDCYELVLTKKGEKLEEAVGGLERYRTEWAEKG